MGTFNLLSGQLSRLISRDFRDILRFLIYRLRMIPTNLSDYYRANVKKNTHEITGIAPSEILNKKGPILDSSKISKFGEGILEKSMVELLGKQINIGWPPTWETDETGSWQKIPSNKIQFYGKEIKNDIKIIWELHRLQWMPSISAYYSTNEDLDGMEELLDIIVDYIRSHPYARTIAWMEGIEITLRSISIIETLSYMKDKISSGPKISEINSYLSNNAMWLERHLSFKWRRNNNHLLLELIGLTILGEYLDWHPDSGKWVKKGSSRLLEELNKQTFEGRNWEPTTAYHRFVTESMLVLEYYCRQKMNADKTFISIKKVISDLVETLFWMSDSFHRMPLIGDDDAGIVLPMSGIMDAGDNSKTLDLAMRLGYVNNRESSGLRIWNEQGIGVIHNNNLSLSFVSGAPMGPGRQASHRHLDMLSVTLSHRGKEIILDGGTGVYFGSKSWRDYFRSERCHSGIYSKQMPWGIISNLFEIKKPPLGQIQFKNGLVEVLCEHPSGVTQTREIRCRDDSIELTDKLVLSEPVIGFMFKKHVDLIECDEGYTMKIGDISIFHSPKPVRLDLQNPQNGFFDARKDYDGKAYFSTGYGKICSGMRVEFIHNKGDVAKTIIKDLGSQN